MSRDIDRLTELLGVSGRVGFGWSPLGGPIVRLHTRGSTAEIALRGAQVLSWRPRDRGEQLWLSPVARLDGDAALRGGIPVCWPWFGPHATDNRQPSHGFVRTVMWRVTETAAESCSASVVFALESREASHLGWPHQAGALLTVSLGDGLTVALETENSGPTSFELTQALHTYFSVGDIAHVRVEGLDERAYLDKLDGNARRVQHGDVRFAQEVDRIYDSDGAALALTDDGADGRRIRIASEGSASTVLWNPWSEKAARLGDMGPAGAYRTMVCVETANAGNDVIRLAPGRRHRLVATYSIADSRTQ